MEGVPVEDNGMTGTIYTHWEKHMFVNELMTGYSGVNESISNFSLKLLEDSGWYEVNYDMAEPFFWAKGSGCKILKGDCGLKGVGCTKMGEGGCHYNYNVQSSCVSSVLNKCFYMSNYSSQITHDCRYSENRDKENGGLSTIFGESYGLGSRCFEGNINIENHGFTSNGNINHKNMCYKAKCQGNKIVM
jgi:hypothetical protein